MGESAGSKRDGGNGGMDRRSFLRSVAVGGAALAAGGLLDACGSASGGQGTAATGTSAGGTSGSAGTAAATPRKGGDLRVGLTGGGSTDTLNPFDGGISAIGTARAQQLYQPLIQLANNAQLQYVLAEEIAPRGTTSTWVIKLRKGVTFHNGKAFGADDVIYTLRTILTQKLGGATVLTPVNVNGMKKLDDLTVEVPMTSPFGSFPEQLASFWYFLYIAPDGWKQSDPPNGTGPFKYKSFTPGQESVFVRNDNYWKPGLPYLDSVTIQDYSDPTSVQNALVSKVIDCTGQLSGAQMKTLQQTPGIVAVPSKTGAIQPFTMRVDKAPFNDVNVRQAFRLIVDRPEVIAASLGGFGWVAADVTSPYDPDYDASLHREQDIPQARHLLKKAGYDNDLKVSLDTSLAISSTALSMAQVFAQQASSAGVTVTINQASATTFFSNDYTKVPFAQIYYDYSPYLAQVAQTFLPTSPFPETHFNDPHYTNLYYEANKTQSPSVRKQIEYEMQQIDFTQGGYIIPCFVDSLDAYSSKLVGYQTGKVGEPLGNFNFEDYWFRS